MYFNDNLSPNSSQILPLPPYQPNYICPPLRITTNNEKSKSPKPVDLKTLKQSKNVCVCMRVYARVRMPTKKKKKHGVYFVLLKYI